MKAKDLVVKGLDGFSVKAMIEVFEADEHGLRAKTSPVGLFENTKAAKAFIINDGGGYYGIDSAIVLTNGEDAFVLEKSAPVFNTHEVIEKAMEKVLSKLSPDERNILG